MMSGGSSAHVLRNAGSGAQVPHTLLLLLLPGNSLSQAIYNVQLPTEGDTGEDFGA